MQLDKIWPKTVHAGHNSWFSGWEAERGTLRRRLQTMSSNTFVCRAIKRTGSHRVPRAVKRTGSHRVPRGRNGLLQNRIQGPKGSPGPPTLQSPTELKHPLHLSQLNGHLALEGPSHSDLDVYSPPGQPCSNQVSTRPPATTKGLNNHFFTKST